MRTVMNDILITPAGLENIAVLQQIARQTFYETFAPHNTAADMEQYLNESFTSEKISTQLNNPDSFFLLAWENNTPVGYVKLNTGTAQTEAQATTALEIERIYVLSAWHGKKVGQLLYEKALETAQQLHKTYLWLGVWEKNTRAIRFYEKNGFAAFDKHIFRIGADSQTDIMMKKVLADERSGNNCLPVSEQGRMPSLK